MMERSWGRRRKASTVKHVEGRRYTSIKPPPPCVAHSVGPKLLSRPQPRTPTLPGLPGSPGAGAAASLLGRRQAWCCCLSLCVCGVDRRGPSQQRAVCGVVKCRKLLPCRLFVDGLDCGVWTLTICARRRVRIAVCGLLAGPLARSRPAASRGRIVSVYENRSQHTQLVQIITWWADGGQGTGRVRYSRVKPGV